MSGSNIFAGTDGGVYLSTNNGTSWTAENTGLGNQSVSSLAMSGSNIFAGTYGGVFLSTNNGTSWTVDTAGMGYPLVSSLAVSGRISLPGLMVAVFISPPTTGQAGLPRILAWGIKCLFPCGEWFEYLCRDLWRRCLSLHQQRDKLDCREYWFGVSQLSLPLR